MTATVLVLICFAALCLIVCPFHFEPSETLQKYASVIKKINRVINLIALLSSSIAARLLLIDVQHEKDRPAKMRLLRIGLLFLSCSIFFITIEILVEKII